MQNKKDRQATRELKKALRDPELSKSEYVRTQAVLLKKKGYALKQIADITEHPVVTVQAWITLYHKRGVDGLRAKQRETSAAAKLNKQQKQHIKTLITGGKPSEYGYPDDFWSATMMRKLVKDQYKIEFKTERSYQKLMKFCGFSYQKAEYVDHRKDETNPKKFKVRLRKRLKKGVFSMSW